MSDSGYLQDPESDWGHILNPNVVPFEAIAETPCLILLGEPGIGKSCAINSEKQAVSLLEDQGNGVIWLDLRSYGSEERLISNLFDDYTFQLCIREEKRLYVFLDSLDECLLRIRNLATLLLDEFEKISVTHIYLRIACRTAELPPILETGLTQLWGKDAVKAFELAPLRKKDVALAIEANGQAAESFLDQIMGRRLCRL